MSTTVKRPRVNLADKNPNPPPRSHRRKDTAIDSHPSVREETSQKPHTQSSIPATSPSTPLRKKFSRPGSIPVQLSDSSHKNTIRQTLSRTSANEAREFHSSLSEPASGRTEMEGLVRLEVDGAVYEYHRLCEEFFDMGSSQVDDILNRLEGNSLLWRNGRWSIDCSDLEKETPEMHEIWAKLLNTIMHAAFTPQPFRPKIETVIPIGGRHMVGDHLDDVGTAPDIVQGPQGENLKRHWGDLYFFAECKSGLGKLSEALLQIARYSWALFTHQIYRKHIFSLALCSSHAIFVRISRSGLIHSQTINIQTDPESFIRAAAGLFSLGDAAFGYNTLFYYWPPLDQEESTSHRELRFVTDNMRWTVVEIICHRMCLVGRATIIVLLRRISNPQHYAVLKLIWRPGTRADESENLSLFKDSPGICRCRWSVCDESTAVRHPESLQPSPSQHKLRELSDKEKREIKKSLPPKSGSKSYQSKLAAANTAKVTQHLDEHVRYYSMILMDQGIGLWRVKHLVHLLRVLRDGIIGYASIANKNQVHRDISEGNILCGPCDDAEIESLWSDQETSCDLDDSSTISPKDTFNRYDFKDISFLVPEVEISESISFPDYVAKRYAKQQPLGKLCDFEFMVHESRGENEVRRVADRTGTFAFMSLAILRAGEENPVRHHFLHDIESFFWVFLWFLFVRAKVRRDLNEQSNKDFENLFYRQGAEDTKHILLAVPSRLRNLIHDLVHDDPGWEKALEFASKFRKFLIRLYPEDPLQSEFLSVDMVWEEKWNKLHEVVKIFDESIQALQMPREALTEVSSPSVLKLF
ncbi:similar to endonuclease/reverse transcriptase [Rhizoctonia solani]|uniref:Similar to endonuclease/reverse transcriptase n=1 Tax=Rhizoctonia solani TaxID=456999 RepID=A0A0K6G7T4_9AGAM|nr:similar to endonuclease/reverse transcriptase [Rhizoctonia solani]